MIHIGCIYYLRAKI